ncbi:MAG TPA: class I SAM-dependent methyltransferase [Gammaproteobacteria bacterium]
MGFYRSVVLPRFCDLSMRSKRLGPYRHRAVAGAKGRTLEIGAGSGLNLALYPPAVTEIIALEPDPNLIAMAEPKARNAPRPVRFVEASAESIPLPDESVETVITTWTLCTIPDPHRALEEMKRVLRRDGTLTFVEHGLSSEPGVQKWQHRLAPAWRRLTGGCHLNRPIAELVRSAGFELKKLETGYVRGPKIMTFMYEGSATRGSDIPSSA